MKHALTYLSRLGGVLAAILHLTPTPLLASEPSITLAWPVETTRVQPVAFDAYHGETIVLKPSFFVRSTPLEVTNYTARIYWQTNGMESVYWETNTTTVASNTVAATFLGSYDTGASAVKGFIALSGGDSRNYRAAFTLRYRQSPGFTPGSLPLPAATIDCASTTFTNPESAPFLTAAATNAIPSVWPIVTNAYTKTQVDAVLAGKASVTSNNPVIKGTIGKQFNYTTTTSKMVWGSEYAQYADYAGSALAATSATSANRLSVSGMSQTIKNLNNEGYHIYEGETDMGAVASSNMVVAVGDASYYPKSQGEAWSSYWDGDDVRVTVTNYDSSVNIPSLYLEQKTNEVALATNLFRTVWREMAHWEQFLGTNWNWRATWNGFSSWSESLEDELDNKADRAWGYYDSHTGEYAPDGYTVVSSSNIMIAANMSYQKTVTASADVWILTANEPYEPTGISTNGGFQIKDSDGNVQFEIIKGNKVTVAAQANAVTVDNTTTPYTLVVTYNIIANAHPTAEVCLDLATANWKTETDSDCPATVTWSGTSGAYVARITPTQTTTKCFVKATYQRGGDTYINNRCAVGMSQIVLNGTTYNLGTATISGNTVLTLTPAN